MKRVHFIAIGGSAMHNLAIALHRQGFEVTGSDDEIFEPSRSRLDRLGLLPDKLGWSPEDITPDVDAVILGMHARIDNPELKRAQARSVGELRLEARLGERVRAMVVNPGEVEAHGRLDHRYIPDDLFLLPEVPHVIVTTSALAPSLQVKTDDNAANPKIFIRGIGLNDFNPTTASAVAIYSDGVYIGSPLAQMGQGGATQILLAVDHPEDYDRYSPMVSRLLHLMVIDILTTAVALRLPGELRPMLQEIKKNLRAKRYARPE